MLTLWAAVVAERLGYDRNAALTLGRAVAGRSALIKGRRIGVYDEAPKARKKRLPKPEGKPVEVQLLGRHVPAVRTQDGIRATERGKPSDPKSVERYLEGKFGDHLAAARRAMTTLAKAYPKETLAEEAFALYERFRPAVPKGQYGWGAKGALNLSKLRELADEAPGR